MENWFHYQLILLGVSLACATCTPSLAQESPLIAQLEFFEREVRPLLVEHCYSCHSNSAKQLRGGLYVDNRKGLLEGGDSGEAIVPGDAESSLFMEAVRYESYEMPPKGQLPDEDIDVFSRWIEMGAPWPEEEKAGPKRETFDLNTRTEEHWAWQPIETPNIPTCGNQTWAKSPIDSFILTRLEQRGLAPSKPADRNAILRRLYFDIVGLPPTTEQIRKFENDRSDQAIENVVDDLLQSPHFGERWGRHWLDLVRYAESRGHEFDNDIPNAFQYRDYVIRALNSDISYDQLIREHIAGDLLDEPRLNPDRGFNESVLGTGFWFLGEWVHSPVDILKDESDRFDNMIDVMSKTFQGMTVSCARCHDHKFDAISTADYYSLTGFLHSSDYRQVRFETLQHNAEIATKLAKLDDEFQTEIFKALEAESVFRPKQSSFFDHESIVVDYENLPQNEFLQDGFIFGSRPQIAGRVYPKADGSLGIATHDAAVNDPFWNGLESVTVAELQNQNKLAELSKSGRTLRTPTFKLNSNHVDCHVQGQGHVIACVDSHRLVHGPLHGETIKKVETDQCWTRLNLSRYVGHRLHLEFVPDENCQLAIRLVTQGLDNQELSDIESRLSKKDEAFESYARAGNALIVLSVQNGESEKNASHLLAQIIDRWQQERADLKKRVMFKSRLAPAMLDGTGEEAQIYVRGDSSKPGEVVPRKYLTALGGEQAMSIRSGSGRLELAAALNDADNPLTSRVIANRIWHYLMGRGIVPTTDDFGVLGMPPTHPELLDHLASRFVADGQSIKSMIRYIVLSQTYQMSSIPNDDSSEADPKNTFWHHRPPKRLEGEVIRDSLLVLSGKFDPAQFGPPVPIHLTSFMDGRGRPEKSGPVDGEGRRSIYVSVRRNFLSPFMLAFDTPVPFSTMGRRNVSNVPAQALILMNDPFVSEQAISWAKRACSHSRDSVERLNWLYNTAFARMPTEKEKQVAFDYLGDSADVDLWANYAHALISTKEFIFVR